MRVLKRSGGFEQVSFDKISLRIKRLADGLEHVDPLLVAQRVIAGVFDGVKTTELDELASETSAYMSTIHPNYEVLASRIATSNLHKETEESFLTVAQRLHSYVNPKNGKASPLLADDVFDVIVTNAESIQQRLIFERDFTYSYFGFKTLARSYLLRLDGKIVERPQHMLMRVSIGIHKQNLEEAFRTYELMSTKAFTHATPTMFNAGLPHPQCSSCFLLTMTEDSIDGIYETLTRCAKISKASGGIGVNANLIRAAGSYIAGTNGTSNGLTPMLRVYNATARYVDQCFPEGTLICIGNNQWRAINDLQVGHLVQTHTGKLCRISKTLQYAHDGPLLHIATNGGTTGLLVTEGHPFLVQDAFGRKDWKEAKFLNAGDKIVSQGKILCIVDHVKEEHYTGKVFDLEVEDDHSYLTEVGFCHNGGGRRKGAFAIYVEPWHADIFDILELKKNTGPDELRARDLFYGLWIPDLFMERVARNKEWTLMCPDECPGLVDTYGPDFVALYEKYEREGKGRRTVRAQDLWFAILESQIESGTPYMLYKDACNAKSNQKNLGTIRGSNLCTEIIEYTSKDEVAVCNLASVSLPGGVRRDQNGEPYYDFAWLFEVVCQMTRNLDAVIDINYYPIPEAEVSNKRHRPIGLGVQGLADVFFMMRYPFDGEKAAKLNRKIFETIYYAACSESCRLAKQKGSYETFAGSPASQGLLQFDLWGAAAGDPRSGSRWDWAQLKRDIAQFGLRNSLLVAPMPTASTAQILGNTECFEPIQSNIFSRTTLAGSFTLVNRYLVDDLMKLGIWSPQLKDEIILAGGSIQKIETIPPHIRMLHKTVWEISQKVILDMAADRAIYIDQSQSLNIHMAEPTFEKLSSMHFYGWKKGLKTGMYYLRTKAAAEAQKFTVEEKKPEGEVCRKENGCITCSS